MTCEKAPAPREFGEIGVLPVHVVVRDYPEVLAILRRGGVDLAAAGAVPLEDVVAGNAELPRAVMAALAWRGTAEERGTSRDP